MAEKPDWFDPTAAAEYLGVSRATLYRWMGQRLIKRFKQGGVVRIRRTELDNFLATRERCKR